MTAPLENAEPRASWAPRRAAWALGLLVATPVLALRYPPMGDLPFHESLVALLRHFGDPEWQPPGVYLRSFGPPNQLFCLAACALSYAVSTDLACKVVIAASIAMTPPAAESLARHFGTVGWSALWIAPLTLGLAFRWGLVGNVVALPLLLLSLPVLDRFALKPAPRRIPGVLALVALLYLAHESALVVAALASTVFAARPGLRPTIARFSPVFAALALGAFYAWWGRHLKAPSILANPDSFGPNPILRIPEAPTVLFGAGDGGPWLRFGLFGVYTLSFVPFVMSRMRSAATVARPASILARIERHRLAWVALTCVAAYFVVPFAFGGSTLLYERFLPVGVALLCVAFAPPVGAAWPRIAPFVGASIAIAALCIALPAFGSSDRRFRELDRLLPLIERNSAVAQLDLTPGSRGRAAPVVGAGGRVLAERGGRLLFSFTDAPTSPVVVSKVHQWNEPVLRLTFDPFAFSPSHDLGLFRYVLVHLDPEWIRLGPTLVRAFAPEGRLVAEAGQWLLFESTLATVPLTAIESSFGAPSGPTLRERLSSRAPGRRVVQ